MEQNIAGAIILGGSGLYFASGENAETWLSSFGAKRVMDLGAVKAAYRNDAPDEQSFLLVDGREVELNSFDDLERTFKISAPDFLHATHDIVTDPGLLAVIAPTRWGKTTLLLGGLYPSLVETYGVEAVQVVNFLEVYGDTYGAPVTYTAQKSELFRHILETLMSEDRNVLMIDSARAFVYGKSVGGTGTKGLDQYFTIQLTALSNMFAAMGKLLVMSINPLVSYDDEKERVRYNELVDQLVAGATGALVGRGPKLLDWSPRGFCNPDRDTETFTVKDLTAKQRITSSVRPIDLQPELEPVVIVEGASSQAVLARRLLTATAVSNKLTNNTQTSQTDTQE